VYSGEVGLHTWIHVAGVFELAQGEGEEGDPVGELRIYVDGDLAESKSVPFEPHASRGQLFVGGGTTNSSMADFQGKLDEISIWNTALNGDEVAALHRQGTPTDLQEHARASNLVSWWRMGDDDDDDVAVTIRDQVGDHHLVRAVADPAAVVPGDHRPETKSEPGEIVADWPGPTPTLRNERSLLLAACDAENEPACVDDYVNVGPSQAFGSQGPFSVATWFKVAPGAPTVMPLLSRWVADDALGEAACDEAEEGFSCSFQPSGDLSIEGSCRRRDHDTLFCAHQDWLLQLWKVGGSEDRWVANGNIGREEVGVSACTAQGLDGLLTDDAWHLAILGWDGSTLVMDIDGGTYRSTGLIEDGESPLTGPRAGPQGVQMLIGARGNAADIQESSERGFFKGWVDETTYWRRYLGPSEVAELYNSGAPIDPTQHSAAADLVAWWRMGDLPADERDPDTQRTDRVHEVVGGYHGEVHGGTIVDDVP
jgi:hypothetical protein